jgi:DNA polymerase-1
MKDTFLIDATHQIHVDYYGNPEADPVVTLQNKLAVFTSHFKFYEFRCIFDSEGETWRHREYDVYKQGRPEKPNDLRLALARAPVCMHVEGHNVLVRGDATEADDIIASAVNSLKDERWKTVIVSGDKDLRQLLVPGRVVILKSLKTERGKVQCYWYNAERMKIETGLRPDQWVDHQILVGDKSDNIAGCPGFGEKRASSLLKEYGSLDRALELAPESEKLTDNLKASLAEFKPKVAVRRKLMTLDTTIDLAECTVS